MQKNRDSMFARMMAVVRRIPRGKVSTYGDIAYAAGYPGRARQVAWALHASHGLPWQRVVGAGGKLLMPGEYGFEQRLRLEAEGVKFSGRRVRMELHRHVWFRKRGRRGGAGSGRRRKRSVTD